VQIPTLLLETIKSGKITISQNNETQLEINVANKTFDIDAKDKRLIKEVLSGAREGAGKGGVQNRIRKGVDQIRAVTDSRSLLKDIAEDLCREGLTITLSYKGEKVATIGSEANSKFTRVVTGTKGIQINSTRKLIELGV
jgi:hypothetical protein